MKIKVSIVIYQPDIGLLKDVVTHLAAAANELAKTRACAVALDIVNNHPGDDAFAQLKAALEVDGPHPSPLIPNGEGIFTEAGECRLAIDYIDSPGNIGYGAANNISIRQSNDTDYHLVLNPDALLNADALVEAVGYMESHPNTGLLVPRVLGFDGEIHHLCKRNSTLFDMFLRSFAPRPLKAVFAERMRRFVMLDYDYGQVISPVCYPSGCFMFFRASLLRDIQGFDEWFFMYLEDADIGRRVLRSGAVVDYVPSVMIRHQWARGTHNNWRLRWATIVSALKYWWKWGGIV